MKKVGLLLSLLLLSAFLVGGQTPVIGTGIATVDTAGEGHFYAITIHNPLSTAGLAIFNVDAVRMMQFVLPYRDTTNRIMTEVTTAGGAGKLYGVGLYDSAKKLVVETGALDANTVQVNETTVPQVTLEPGVYWYAWTADTTTVQFRLNNIENDFIKRTATTRHGLILSVGSSGVLPATLGTITESNASSPLALFYIE